MEYWPAHPGATVTIHTIKTLKVPDREDGSNGPPTSHLLDRVYRGCGVESYRRPVTTVATHTTEHPRVVIEGVVRFGVTSQDVLSRSPISDL